MLVNNVTCDMCDDSIPAGDERPFALPYPPELLIGGRRRHVCAPCTAALKRLTDPDNRGTWKPFKAEQVKFIAAEDERVAAEDAARAEAGREAQKEADARTAEEAAVAAKQHQAKLAALAEALANPDPVARLKAGLMAALAERLDDDEREQLEKVVAGVK